MNTHRFGPLPALVRPHPTGRCAAGLLGLAVIALIPNSQCLAADLLLQEDFQDVSEWHGPNGSGAQYATWRLANGQAIMRFDRPEATDPDGIASWHGNWIPARSFNLGANTLELRVDLVGTNRDDAFTLLGVNQLGGLAGYWVGRDRNEIFLCKFGNQGGWYTAYPYASALARTYANTTLSLAFTPCGTGLAIRTQILDPNSAYAVLWEKTVIDTDAADPMLANHAWKGLTMDPERYGPSITGPVEAMLAIAYLNTQVPPAEPSEVTVDNFMVFEYPAPAETIEKAACLISWPVNTAEEQIVVGAASVAGPWTPWPEPIFKRFGVLCLAVRATSAQQFFTLTSGNQFIDDFDAAQWPYASKGEWVAGFYEPQDAARWTRTPSNGGLRLQTPAPPVDPSGRLPLRPPGPVVEFADFWAAVDIIDLSVIEAQAGVGIAARLSWDPATGWPGDINGCIGSLKPNRGGLNRAQLTLFSGSSPTDRGTPFTFTPGTPYRLIFSGVGQRLSVEVVDLKLQQPAVTPLVVTNSNFARGLTALWFQSGAAPFDATVDNFFVTGTKP